ncbi:HAMP domain-containing histidine kinase [Sphingomonas populi]|uniref:histidine kinase n=2 Tax=Sphingomonas populi TaxID=2484750 RepID=A0A4Q6XM87_9SPHN|nr:ATP-binding protein [Sphingomonas populi]RZF61011.1 HAMP domain-containing histidine kinase [Sphingomonas populi]
MVLLVQLRWLAVAGQLATILVVQFGMGVELPLRAMVLVLAALVVVNLASLSLLHQRRTITNSELLVALLLDVAALTTQLYLSGGATNPFVSLFLLQVVLGAILLGRWSSWALVVVTCGAFALLMRRFRPLDLPISLASDPFGLHIVGSLACFALVAVLLVLFVTRISGNLRARDAYVADMRQRAADQDHILQIGLLASGAAHELGTPLASLAVILGDWRRMPRLAADPELAQDMAEMQAEVERCKAIVTGILMSAGEARGEAPEITSVHGFFADLVDYWRARGTTPLTYDDAFGADVSIVSDTALKQVICNVLDNAAEVSPQGIGLVVERDGDAIRLCVRDAGPGFAPDMLANLGKPYQSTKQRPGGGLGLFLVVNVMRKLGGSVAARNLDDGGAEVTLRLPLASLALEAETPDV